MFHSKGKRRFPSTFPSRRLRSWTPLTLQFHLAWTHSKVRRTFSGASTCPGCTSPPPRMHWGLLILPQSAYAKRSFNLFLPVLAQRRGGILLFLASTRSKARRFSSFLAYTSLKGEEDFFSFSPALAQRRGGLLLFLACTRLKVRRTSSLASGRTRALRALNITGASDRRKMMRSLKLLTIAADRRKTMGT